MIPLVSFTARNTSAPSRLLSLWEPLHWISFCVTESLSVNWAMSANLAVIRSFARSPLPPSLTHSLINHFIIQITCLDFLVNYESSFEPPNILSEVDKHLSDTVINIHWWFKLVDGNDVEKLIRFVNTNEVRWFTYCHFTLLKELVPICE